MYPRSVPPLDESPTEDKSLPTKPAQQQPEPGPKQELSTQLNPVANGKCNSKRSSSDLSLSSSKSETGALDKFSGDRAKSFVKLFTTGDAEHDTSDTQSTRTGSSVNCSEPLVLNQPNPHPKEGLEFRPGTAIVGSTPSTPDASTGDPRRLVVEGKNQSSTEAEKWTTKADDHLPKDGMAAESLSDLKTHSSAESLISNDPSILERSRSSPAFRQVSGPASTDLKEPISDKQAQKDPPRRNGSALGNLLTGKWLRTVGESKTPPVNQKASRKQGPASSTTYGTGNEIGGDEASDHVFDRIRNATAGDAASTTSSSQTTINVNAVHDGSTVPRAATRPATPGLTAEQSETVPEVASAKKAVKSATQEGKSPSHQSGSMPATSACGSPREYSRYPVRSHAIDRARAGKPAAASSGDLRLTITFKDCISHGPAMRRAKVTVLLETEEDLMVETNVEEVEQENGRDDPSDQG